MLKRKPANEYHQKLPHYESKYEPKQNNIDFESAKKVLMEADKKIAEKRRFERIYHAIETMTYTKYEVIPGNKKIFIYGLKYVKTVKIDNYILMGCESEELYENDKLFVFWSNKFINAEMQKRKIKITGWPFLTLLRRNSFFKVQGIGM